MIERVPVRWMLDSVLVAPQVPGRVGRSRTAATALLGCWGSTISGNKAPRFVGSDHTRSSMFKFSALEIAFIAAIDPSRFPASI